MPIRTLVRPGAATVLAVAGVVASFATAPSVAGAAAPAASVPVTYLAGGLLGRNEVTPGDPDARATAVVSVQGNQVSYAVRWTGAAAPTRFHIHEGGKGVNGGIKVDFFNKLLPASARAVSGTVTVDDAALLTAITTKPGDFYVNLHTGEFPGGAVRSQLHKLNRPVDLDGVLNGPRSPRWQARPAAPSSC